MIGGKKNTRKYPRVNNKHGNMQPNHHAKFRKDEAVERQVAYNQLSTAEKIAKLDAKLGEGVGAKKQRIRLAASR